MRIHQEVFTSNTEHSNYLSKKPVIFATVILGNSFTLVDVEDYLRQLSLRYLFLITLLGECFGAALIW